MKQISEQAEDHWSSIYEEIKGRGTRSGGDYTVVPGTSREEVKGDLMKRQEERQANPCEWEYNQGDSFWQAECGFAFILEDGNPTDHYMNYCPGCGSKIGLSAYEPEEGDFYWTEESFNRVVESLEGEFVTVPFNLKTGKDFEAWLLSLED